MHTVVVPLDFNNTPRELLQSGSLPCHHCAFILPLAQELFSYRISLMTQPVPRPCCQPTLALLHPLGLCLHPSCQGRAPTTHWEDLCGFRPSSTKYKLNVTADVCLGQRKAETKEEKCFARYFCASLMLLQPVRDSSLDLERPQGADYWSAATSPHSLPLSDPTYSSDSHTHKHFHAGTKPYETLPFWNHLCTARVHLQHPVQLLWLPAAIIAGNPLDLRVWNISIRDLQNGSQITFFLQESQSPCSSWENPGVGSSIGLIKEKRNDGRRRTSRWGMFQSLPGTC